MKGPRFLAGVAVSAGLATGYSFIWLANGTTLRSAFSQETATLPRVGLPAARGQEAIGLLKQKGLYDSLEAAYRAGRYRVGRIEHQASREQSVLYRAFNPEQQMAVSFAADKVHIAAGGSESPDASWLVRLTGYGHGNVLQSPEQAEPWANDNLVQYRRGRLTEWYVNDASGLEQGFTLAQPPPGPAGEPLVLTMAVDTELQNGRADGINKITFVDSMDRVRLQYGNLRAWDASGKDLPATMEASTGQIALRIDDSSAIYPVTIDPLIYNETKLNASDGFAYNQFGSSLAISGDTVIVGAANVQIKYGPPGSPGSVYVFTYDGALWIQEAELTASDGAPNNGFGVSVAIDGDDVIIGAPYDDPAARTWKGAAYVFVRSMGIWSEQQKLTGDDLQNGDFFGVSAGISGDTAVVGALSQSAYVFVRSDGTWTQQQKLIAIDALRSSGFGRAVAISLDTIAVGAQCVDSFGNCVDPGSVYIFVRSGDIWTRQQKLLVDADFQGSFGSSAAITGDILVAGAPLDSTAGNLAGAAYVFVRTDDTWSQLQKLTVTDGIARLGYSVGISGNTIVAGGPYADSPRAAASGAAYVFHFDGNTWVQDTKLTASDEQRADLFGIAVATNGDTIVAGAPSTDPFGGGGPYGGAAYVYTSPTPVF